MIENSSFAWSAARFTRWSGVVVTALGVPVNRTTLVFCSVASPCTTSTPQPTAESCPPVTLAPRTTKSWRSRGVIAPDTSVEAERISTITSPTDGVLTKTATSAASARRVCR